MFVTPALLPSTILAMILLMTILHATIGSFVIYIVLCDLFGPAEPTKFVDGLFKLCFKCDGDDISKDTDDLVLTKDNSKGHRLRENRQNFVSTKDNSKGEGVETALNETN
jgi:hypothetical protein